ncbi:MAG TPA: hypothetical protein VFO94_12485, partial [Gammaproteobacteria bacterium]|nr:hypothetical protein [Gammaproteobacteria bacterium]
FIWFTDPHQPVSRKLFRKVDVTAQLTSLVKAVDAILAADADIRELAWREHKDVASRRFASHAVECRVSIAFEVLLRWMK